MGSIAKVKCFIDYFLGAKKPSHISALPNKGSLFENFIVASFYKQIYNKGQQPNYYFYRDNGDYEIDLISGEVKGLSLYKIKMGETYTSNFAKNINYFCKLSIQVQQKAIIYSGKNRIVKSLVF